MLSFLYLFLGLDLSLLVGVATHRPSWCTAFLRLYYSMGNRHLTPCSGQVPRACWTDWWIVLSRSLVALFF